METAPTVVNLLALDAAGLRDALQWAITTGRPVYLDALEIAARYVPNLFFILEDCLSDAAAAGVPWRLGCRPAAWEGARAAGLDSALPGFRQLRLLPLTRAAATDVVSGVTSSPDRFLEEAVRAGLGRLAASPLRLLSAASQWEVTGHLPDSQLSAMQYQVKQLLKETSRRQQTTVPDDRRRRLAGRLAAMSVFGLADRSRRPRSLRQVPCRSPVFPQTQTQTARLRSRRQRSRRCSELPCSTRRMTRPSVSGTSSTRSSSPPST